MSVSVQIGLLLALATAFASVLGFLYKHRGAVESPDVEMRRPIRTSLALFRSPAYTLGIVIAMAGWGLHVGALSLAPISLVQSVIAGGLVLLTVTADRLFGFRVSRRGWVGGALTAPRPAPRAPPPASPSWPRRCTAPPTTATATTRPVCSRPMRAARSCSASAPRCGTG